MNEEIFTPGVPTLSDDWIAQRTQHLIEEVATLRPVGTVACSLRASAEARSP